MGSLNRAIILGRVGAKPELRYTQGGKAVCNFSLATDEGYTDQAGVKHDAVEWHRIVAWDRTAEIAAQYLDKGALVLVEGKLQTREWEKDGHKNKSTEIVARTIQLTGRASDGPTAGDASGAPRGGAAAPAQPRRPTPPPARAAAAAAAPADDWADDRPPADPNDPDSDLPF